MCVCMCINELVASRRHLGSELHRAMQYFFLTNQNASEKKTEAMHKFLQDRSRKIEEYRNNA